MVPQNEFTVGFFILYSNGLWGSKKTLQKWCKPIGQNNRRWSVKNDEEMNKTDEKSANSGRKVYVHLRISSIIHGHYLTQMLKKKNPQITTQNTAKPRVQMSQSTKFYFHLFWEWLVSIFSFRLRNWPRWSYQKSAKLNWTYSVLLSVLSNVSYFVDSCRVHFLLALIIIFVMPSFFKVLL